MPRPLVTVSHRFDRRRFLAVAAGGAAGAVLLGACSGNEETSDDAGGADGTTSTPGSPSDGLALAQFFGGPMFVAGQPARTPFGVADVDGLVAIDATPERLDLEVLDPAMDIVSSVQVERHDDGLERAYFPLVFTPEESGIYTVRTEIGGEVAEMAVNIDAEGDVIVIQPGAPLPSLDTPTTSEPRGVEPICTSDPACPLHSATLAEALAEERPIALLVATPAFCQIAVCGPVLDVLLDAAPEHGDIRFLHAEVYADPYNDLEQHAPVVAELGLHFEPCLLLVGSDGTLVQRLDTIYDRVELEASLQALA